MTGSRGAQTEVPAAAGTTGARDAARRARPWAVLVLAVVTVALVAGRPQGEGDPLDPRGTGELGTRALVVLLEEVGAEVEVGAPPGPATDAALVLADDLDEHHREALLAWAERGGRLVVTDPRSPLLPFPTRGTLPPFADELEPDCRLLADVGPLTPPGGVTFARPEGAVGCYPTGDGYFVVAEQHGAGAVVGVGGAGSITNRSLDEGANAVLAVALLAPREGDRVVVVEPPRPGEGRRDLLDLVHPGVVAGLVQLGVAFLAYAWWRARRLGRPLPPDRPVELPGTELVGAIGRLLHRARAREQAATVLRDVARRRLGERLGLGPAPDLRLLAERVAARAGRPTEEVLALLVPGPVTDDRALVDLAAALDDLDRGVTRPG